MTGGQSGGQSGVRTCQGGLPRALGPAARAALAAITAAAALPAPAVHAQDFAPGERLAMIHCGRCHVIGPRNRMGGIGSTPSFAALRTLDDWRDRFAVFYTLNPHPAFTQIPDVTPPFPEERPSPIAPVVLSLDDLERITGYAETVEPRDLGSPVR